MIEDDVSTPERPGARGSRGRQRRDGASHAPASYAPIVARLRRGLPALPADRRSRARPGADIWRGVLLDIDTPADLEAARALTPSDPRPFVAGP